MARLFISYDRDDRVFVTQLTELLARTYGPDSFGTASDALQLPVSPPAVYLADAEVCIFVASPAALQSAQCRREVEAAAGQKKSIVILLAEPVDAAAAAQFPGWADAPQVDLTDGLDQPQGLAALYRAISFALGHTPTTSASTAEIAAVLAGEAAKSAPEYRESQRMIWLGLLLIGALIFGLMALIVLMQTPG